MRLRIRLDTEGIQLPVDYSRGIQAFIYSSLSINKAKALHDSEHGIIKPFVFSNIQGPFSISGHTITFTDSAVLEIASSELTILNDLYTLLKRTGKIDIHGHQIDILESEAITNPVCKGAVTYRTISPVTVYDTNPEGHHYFYSPEDEGYAQMIFQNVRRKYQQVYGEETSDFFHIYMPRNIRKRICKYKGFLYTAYDFTMKINTSEKIHNLIMDLGIGARNAAGFGMIKRI